MSTMSHHTGLRSYPRPYIHRAQVITPCLQTAIRLRRLFLEVRLSRGSTRATCKRRPTGPTRQSRATSTISPAESCGSDMTHIHAVLLVTAIRRTPIPVTQQGIHVGTISVRSWASGQVGG